MFRVLLVATLSADKKMPHYRKGDRLIHYVAIPKTYTSSVEKLLQNEGWVKDMEIFNELARLTRNVVDTRHAHADAYNQLSLYNKLNNIKIDYEFATVRHPVERIKSTIYFLVSQWNKGMTKIPREHMPIEDITPQVIIKFIYDIFTLAIPKEGLHTEYNVFLPQHRFVNPDTVIFKCEKLTSLLNELKEQDIISKNAAFPHKNRSTPKNFKKVNPDWYHSPSVSNYFFKFYKKDFELFNYDYFYDNSIKS